MRYFIFITALFFAFSLSSCGSKETKQNTEVSVNKQEKSSVQQSKTTENKKEAGAKEATTGEDIKPEHITAEQFRKKIWDYKQNPSKWVYNGDLPCVVDFYADWCRPCKMVAPIMDELADYYKGKVLFYKVNTDEQRELATVFQIRSIPSILFAPKNGKPSMQAGAMSKEQYIRIIDEYVLGNKKTSEKKNNNNNNKQS